MTTKVNSILLSKKEKFVSVTSKKFNTETDFLNNVAQILNSGADIIEFKDDSLKTASLIQLGKKLRDLTAVFDSLLIIYDRIDIAKLIGADGISLDNNSMSIDDAKKLTEDNLLIGYYMNTDETQISNKIDFIITKEKNKINNIKTFFIEI